MKQQGGNTGCGETGSCRNSESNGSTQQGKIHRLQSNSMSASQWLQVCTAYEDIPHLCSLQGSAWCMIRLLVSRCATAKGRYGDERIRVNCLFLFLRVLDTMEPINWIYCFLHHYKIFHKRKKRKSMIRLFGSDDKEKKERTMSVKGTKYEYRNGDKKRNLLTNE